MPTSPHSDAGARIEPEVSVPIPTSAIPEAVATAGPELEPPDSRPRSSGFRQLPQCGFWPSIPYANSFVLPFPITIAPAARSAATTGASQSGVRRQRAAPAVV